MPAKKSLKPKRHQPAVTSSRSKPRNITIYGVQNEDIEARALAEVIIMLGRELRQADQGLLPPEDRPEDRAKERQ